MRVRDQLARLQHNNTLQLAGESMNAYIARSYLIRSQLNVKHYTAFTDSTDGHLKRKPHYAYVSSLAAREATASGEPF